MLRKIFKGLGIQLMVMVIGTAGVYFISRHNILKQLDALNIDQVTVPTLILNGTADGEVDYEDSEDLASQIPGARLYTVEGASHAMLITHKDELNGVIRDFLDDVAGPDVREVIVRQ